MHCNEVKQLLSQSGGQVEALPQAGRTHLTACEDCAEYAENLEFSHLLRQIPVVPASEGFTDRALQQAWRQGNRNDDKEGSSPIRAMAVAACLVLATSVALHSLWPARETEDIATSPQIVRVIPEQINEVNLLMVSAVNLPEATITLRMDANVQLAGYAGNQELRWPASLTAGNNQLTLPIQLQGVDSGNISVHVESNGATREMMLTVDAMPRQRAAVFAI